jgi:hypothetical protein
MTATAAAVAPAAPFVAVGPSDYLNSKPATGSTQRSDQPKAPTTEPAKEPTKAPTKPAPNATTKPASNFSVNKTNVSIQLTELGNHYPRECAHLNQEKKLPGKIQEKHITHTKKINFFEAALAASKTVGPETGGAELETKPGPSWPLLVDTSSKWTVTIILLVILLAVKGGEAFACWQAGYMMYLSGYQMQPLHYGRMRMVEKSSPWRGIRF